jgi:gliding motility-associated-like protein/uncharacterized repeat protein (TIGR01451 family)
LTTINNGPSAATNVSVQDLLPSGYTYVSSNAPVGTTYDNTTGIWSIGNLANGATSTLTITTRVNTSGNYANTATVTGNESDLTPGNNSSTVTTTPSSSADLITIKMLKDPTQTTFIPGQDVFYMISVSNQGPSAANNVNIQDLAPAGTTLSSWRTVSSGGVIYPNATGTGNLNETIATLANGSTAIYEVTLSTSPSFTGNLVNTVVVTSTTPDPTPGPCTTCSTTPIPANIPEVVISNALTPNGDGKNDTFVIDGIENYPGSTLVIYNRWGNEVYYSNNYSNNWSGENLSGGTYYYLLTLKTPQQTKVYKGWVELLK